MKKMLKMMGIMAALAMVMGMAFVSCKAEEEEKTPIEQLEESLKGATYKDGKLTVGGKSYTLEEYQAAHKDQWDAVEKEMEAADTDEKMGALKKKYPNISKIVEAIMAEEFETPGGDGNKPAGDDEKPAEDPNVVTASTKWNFQDLDMSSVTFDGATWNATSGAAKVKLANPTEFNYNKLMITNGASGGSYNNIKPDQSCGDSVTFKNEDTKDDCKGAIEPSKIDMVYAEVQGPFTAKMYCGSNASSDKTDRYPMIKIGDTEYTNPDCTAKLPTTGCVVEAKYDGTDTVKVYFGGSNITRIYLIEIVK